MSVRLQGTVERILFRSEHRTVAVVRPLTAPGRRPDADREPRTTVSLRPGAWELRRGDFVSCAVAMASGSEVCTAVGVATLQPPVELTSARPRLTAPQAKDLQRSLARHRADKRRAAPERQAAVIRAAGEWWAAQGLAPAPLAVTQGTGKRHRDRDADIDVSLWSWFRSLGLDCSAARCEAVLAAYPRCADPVRAIQRDLLGLLDVKGFGLQTTLRIAERMQLSDEHKDELFVMGLVHQQADEAQYTCSTVAYLQARWRAHKFRDARADVAPLLERLAAKKRLKWADDADGGNKQPCVMLPVLHRAEEATARLIRTLLMSSQSSSERSFQVPGALEGQARAVRNALFSRFSIVTGGAGTGKSQMLRFLEQQQRHVRTHLFAFAPTHRAKRRVRAVLAEPASECMTLHAFVALLERRAAALDRRETDADWGRKETSRLAAWTAGALPAEHQEAVLVFDEMSMVDQTLLGRTAALLMQLGLVDQSRLRGLVLMGDPDQLPSIGPGDVLRQLRDFFRGESKHTGRVLTELDVIVRQRSGDGSGLLSALSAIQRGELPADSGGDGFSWMDLPESGFEHEVQRLLEREARDFGAETWIMAPTHRTIGRYTPALRGLLNPPVAVAVEAKANADIDGFDFRASDRILFRQNWHEEQIFNGDVGTLTHAEEDGEDPGRVIVRLTLDDRAHAGQDPNPETELTLTIEKHDCPFVLAYMTTVHAAQGSESDRVVVVADRHAGPFLTRNLLYTAVSRAKKHCLLLAPVSVIAAAVQRQTPDRLTRLIPRLRLLLAE
jgi:exodeoxyribonuclease V alpha subunit